MEKMNFEPNVINLDRLTHIKVNNLNSEYVVTLTDATDMEVLKGYGRSIIEAMNDLLDNLI